MTTEQARMAEGLSRRHSTRNIGTTTELSQNVAARVTKTARAKKARVVQRKKAKGVKVPRAVTPE